MSKKRPPPVPRRRPDRRAQTSRENGRKGGKPKGAGVGPQGPQLATRLRAVAIQQHAELTAEATVEQIARGALFDPGAFFDEQGHLIPLHKLTEAQRQCIAGVEVVMKNAAAGDNKVDRVLKYKFVDRSKFVQMAAVHHGLQILKIDATFDREKIGRHLDAARLRAAKGRKP